MLAAIETPNAVAFAQGSLFVMGVAEGVWRFDNADSYAIAGVSFSSGSTDLPKLAGVNIVHEAILPHPFNPYPQHRWKYIAISSSLEL